MSSGRAAVVVRLNLHPGSAEHRAVLDLLESRTGPFESMKIKRQRMGECAIDLLSYIARGVDLREEATRPPLAAEPRQPPSQSQANPHPPAADTHRSPPTASKEQATPDQPASATASIDTVLDRLDELDMVKVVAG